MGKLLAYSGLTTKIRAMESNLITEDEYRRLSEYSSVSDVVSFLKTKPGYAEVLDRLDEDHLMRNELEPYLYASIYWGFIRIYRFSGQEQKKFLNLYFQRYELFIIKRYLHMMEDNKTYVPRFGTFDKFMRRHTQLDLEKLSGSHSMDELVQNLKGTDYYPALKSLMDRGSFSSFDYEMALDMDYFNRIWKSREKILTGESLDSLTKVFGTKFDLLNLDWIYRSKKYYHLSEGEIYALLIPMHYRLKRQEITALVEASGLDEFTAVLANTSYAGKYEELAPGTLEEMYVYILRSTLEKEARNHPYSIASIYTYLYKKEHEIDKITTLIECIQYHMDAATIYQYIAKS